MEKIKEEPVAISGHDGNGRKPYEAPAAEVILLTPQENLALEDFKFHQDQDSYRWGLGGWTDFFATSGLNDPASGVAGTVNPEGWVPPVE